MRAAPPEEELALIDAGRLEARAAEGGSQRRTIAESVIDRRRRLLHAWPDSPMRADWLLDQAEDLLLLLLPSDGSDLLALFGRPLDVERTRTADVINEALACLRESAAERSRPRSGASAVAAEDHDGAVRREALLRGLALVMHAECTGSDSATMQRQEAVSALTPLVLELEPAGRRLAQTFLALALSALGRPDEALALLGVVSRDAAAAPLDRLRAELAAATALRRAGDHREASRRLATLATNGRPGATDAEGFNDPFTRLLVADAQVALQLEHGEPAAWLPYRSLLANSGAAERQVLRPVVLARAAAMLPDESDVATTPPFLALAALLQHAEPSTAALAALLAREDCPPMERLIGALALGEALHRGGDGQRAADALLEAARRDRGDPGSTECLQRAAVLVTESWHASPDDRGRRDLARATYETVLAEFPDLPNLEVWRLEAARLALADGREREAQALLEAIAGDSPQRAAADLVQIQAIAAGARRLQGPEGRQRWRAVLDALDLLAARHPDPSSVSRTLLRAEALVSVDEPAAALDLLAKRPTCTPTEDAYAWRLTLDALDGAGRLSEAPALVRQRLGAGEVDTTLRVLVAMLNQWERSCIELEDADRGVEAQEMGRQRMLPLALAVGDVLASGEPKIDATLRAPALLLAARGNLRGDRPREALKLIDRLLREQPDVLDHVVTRAEALYKLGSASPIDEQALGEAMLLLKRIAAARRAAHDRAFWLAETLQLETLRLLGRSTEQIAPRVEQLRRIDPELGGAGWRRRLEAVGLAR